MKNEQKVSKICDLIGFADKSCLDEVYREDIEDALLGMAEWKDEKFKQQLIEYRNKVIKEVCNWLRESTNFSSYGQLVIRKNYRHKEDCIKQLEKAIKSKL